MKGLGRKQGTKTGKMFLDGNEDGRDKIASRYEVRMNPKAWIQVIKVSQQVIWLDYCDPGGVVWGSLEKTIY